MCTPLGKAKVESEHFILLYVHSQYAVCVLSLKKCWLHVFHFSTLNAAISSSTIYEYEMHEYESFFQHKLNDYCLYSILIILCLQ